MKCSRSKLLATTFARASFRYPCRCKLRRGCDLDVSETLHVLDDRLFDYVETECSDNDAAGDYLAYCVRISDLIREQINRH